MTPDLRANDAYSVLGIPRDADAGAIRKAFRLLALERHPDAQPEEKKEEAGILFARVNEAHSILRDPERRRIYDDLLSRGAAPQLGQDLAEASRFQSLAEILGEIASLGFEADEERLLAGLDPVHRDELVKPALISNPSVREHVLEAFFTRLESSEGLTKPEGVNDTGGVLVCTELRLILVARYFYSAPGTNMIVRELRRTAIPFEAVSDLAVHELGRWRPQYRLEVTSRSGEKFVAGLKRTRITADGTFNGFVAFGRWITGSRLRFARLLFLAHVHGVPVRVVTGGSFRREATWVAVACLIPFFFAQLFALVLNLAILSSERGARRAEAVSEMVGLWTGASLFALALGAPFLIAGLLSVRQAWAAGRPDLVFGPASKSAER